MWYCTMGGRFNGKKYRPEWMSVHLRWEPPFHCTMTERYNRPARCVYVLALWYLFHLRVLQLRSKATKTTPVRTLVNSVRDGMVDVLVAPAALLVFYVIIVFPPLFSFLSFGLIEPFSKTPCVWMNGTRKTTFQQNQSYVDVWTAGGISSFWIEHSLVCFEFEI